MIKSEKETNMQEREAVRLLREISSSIPGLVYQFKVDKHGNQTFPYVSEGSRTLLGIEPQEIYDDVQLGFAKVHPDDLEPLLFSIKDSSNTLQQWLFTFRVTNVHGKPHKWIRANSIPRQAEDGSVVWNGTMIDVTEAKEAEDELKLIKRVIENAEEGISICDAKHPNHPIVFVNKAFEKLYGYDSCEILGNNRTILFADVTDGIAVKDLLDAISNKTSFCREIIFRKKDGTNFWNKFTLTPIPDENGEITHFVGFHSDISKRKSAEEALELLNETLEKKVLERTAALTDANRELETFNYTVSHDLQSPLRVVNGYAKLLTKNFAEKLDDDGKHYLKTIESSALQMSKLVRELLAFAKLGKTQLNKSSVNMRDVVEMALTDVKLTSENFRAGVTVKDLKPVNGDFGLLKQVWTNLIDNAVKYSSKKEHPKIEIGMIVQQIGNVYYVKDNGAGFDMKYAQRLFEVFQRMSNATEFNGTGVGLATVHRIVTKHGGKIWAEAEDGKGATFFFTIG